MTFVIDKTGKCVMTFNDQMDWAEHSKRALQVRDQSTITPPP